jgi:integrase
MASLVIRAGKRGPRYSVVFDEPGVDGGRHQRRHTFACEADARDFLASLTRPEVGTVGAWLREWIDLITLDRRPSTCLFYERTIRLHLLPALGDVPLDRLTTDRLASMYAAKQAAGGSVPMLWDMHRVLSAAMQDAVTFGRITDNPCRRYHPTPYLGPDHHTVWSADQVRVFLLTAVDDPHIAYWHLLATLGLRRGEGLALQWGDIDWDARTLSIQRTVTKIKGGWGIGPPKTAHGRRTVPLPASCLDALRAQRTRQNLMRLRSSTWVEGEWIFTTRTGQRWTPESADHRFRDLVQRAHLPSIRLHDLRHTAATLMLAHGVNPKVVSDILGHSKVQITLDLYAHPDLDVLRAATDHLAAMISAG